MTPPVLGLVVNPVAGMGGRLALHGTDGLTLAEARERGVEPIAPARARRALARLHELLPELDVLTVGGVMGSDHLPAEPGPGWRVRSLLAPAGDPVAADTRAAVAAMADAGVRLLLFVGGDGTARDVAAAVRGAGGALPVLGVPSGVKMHSAVFGLTPDAAALATARFLADPARCETREAEVVDRDAEGAVRLFGTVRVPVVPATVQQAKGASAPDTDDAAALAAEVVEQMEPGRLYLLGPGTTVAQVGEALGLASTPLGVDAVLDGRLVASDASEAELLALLQQHHGATLLLGVVGGQGFLLGRGNQQLSPAVLAALGPGGVAGIEVLATPAKVAALGEPVLHVDLDDPDLAASLVGYKRVRTGRARSTVLRIVA